MLRMKKIILAVSLVVFLVGVYGFGQAATDSIVIGRAMSTNAMDPGFMREAATIVDNIFDTLILRDKQMKLVPGLALSWKALDDTTWQFKLRNGVQFHNGEKFDAQAVKFTIDRVLNPENNAPTISYIRTIGHVDVIDPYTVNIVTKKPDPLIPSRLSRYPTYIVPPKYVAQIGQEKFSQKPVGTGPYKFQEWIRDDHLTLTANEAYWRGAPKIKSVTWRPIPEESSRVAALLAGEVDIIEALPVDQIELVKKNPATRVERVPYGGLIVYFGINMDHPILKDKRVRQAMAYAIDRKMIVEKVLQGYATEAASQVGPYDFGYLKVDPWPYDPQKAKQLLTEAGYPEGFEIDMEGVRRYMKGAEVSQAVAYQLGQIGIKVNLEMPEWTVYIQKVPVGKQAPLYMLAWGSTQTLDADAAIYAIYKSGEPYSTVKLPVLDELLEKTRSTVNAADREAIYHQIQEIAYAEVPCLTLYQQDTLFGFRNNIDWKGRVDARIPIYDIRFK